MSFNKEGNFPLFLLFICVTYSRRSSPAPQQPLRIWGWGGGRRGGSCMAGKGLNITRAPRGPQTQHPWVTAASLSTPLGSQPWWGTTRDGPGGPVLAEAHRPWGQTASPPQPSWLGGPVPRDKAKPRGHAAARGAVPWLSYIFCLSDAGVRLGGINFSAAVGKVIRLIKWHASPRAPRAWPPPRGREIRQCPITAPGIPSVPTTVPSGAVRGATRGGRQVLGISSLSAAAGAISIPETRLHPLNRKQTQN